MKYKEFEIVDESLNKVIIEVENKERHGAMGGTVHGKVAGMQEMADEQRRREMLEKRVDMELDKGKVLHNGYLLRKSKKNWKKNWVVLRPQSLMIYNSNEEYKIKKLIKAENIRQVARVESSKYKCLLAVVSEDKKIQLFRSDSEKGIETWIKVIRECRDTAIKQLECAGLGETKKMIQAAKVNITVSTLQSYEEHNSEDEQVGGCNDKQGGVEAIGKEMGICEERVDVKSKRKEKDQSESESEEEDDDDEGEGEGEEASEGEKEGGDKDKKKEDDKKELTKVLQRLNSERELKSGYLYKKANLIKWNMRYFTLRSNTLSWYLDGTVYQPIRIIDRKNIQNITAQEKNNRKKIRIKVQYKGKEKEYVLTHPDEAVVNDWIEILNRWYSSDE